MYLKRIVLQGFKSFARKTALDFEPGITVVVGPNGSGKSNVSDAIKWVLGEQSMKNLRSKKSGDVIFAGSKMKAKSGMAEVTVELDNSNKLIDIDYTDLVITRRVYSSGEGEYFINGNKVRLLDIAEILSRSGFGRSTYTVIGQGTVDRLITQTTQERLELFKDASGVKHFYFKKEQALKKFEESRENLLRVEDIIKELKPRLNSLEKQRRDAEERQIYSKELKEFQRKYYGSGIKFLNDKLTECDQKYNEISKEIENVNQEIKGLTNKLEERAEISDKNLEIDLEQKIENLNAKINRLQEDLLEEVKNNAVFLEKQKFFKENQENILNNLKDARNQIEEKEKLKEKIKSDQSLLKEKLDEAIIALKKLDNNSSNQKSYSFKEIILEIKEKLLKIKNSIKRGSSLNSDLLNKELENLIDFLNKQEKQDNSDFYNKKIEITQKIEKIKFEISSGEDRVKNLHEILEVYFDKEKEFKKQLNEGENLENKKIEDSQKGNLGSLIQDAKKEKEKLKVQLEGIRVKNREIEGKFFDVEKTYRIKRDVLSDLKEELTRIEIETARYKTKKEDLEIEIKENLNSLDKLELILLDEGQRSIMQGKINSLKRKLEYIGGAISEDDEKEYNEVKERFDFLSNQSEDLKNALSSTKKIVLDLENQIHDQFREKFFKISDKFNHYFQKLFGGGMANLILTEGENDEEMVIDIQAVPPGKKVHTLHTLSGGEKALTSVALLFAIFNVNPTPFCVLDEVDAALDESNSIRFADLLLELSKKTQFIIISHNRETMKRSNVLYGVTMDDARISKILSLHLEEAQKYSEAMA